MQIVKTRRVGTSDVITIPREFTQNGYATGTFVAIDQLPNGDLILRRVDSVREAVRAVAAEVVTEDREDLDYLAAYDRGDEAAPKQSRA